MGGPPKCSRVRSLMRLLGNQGPRRMFAARPKKARTELGLQGHSGFFFVFARKGTAIVSIAALVIGLRITMLWLIPVPVPAVHDEFSFSELRSITIRSG
jgi:hypothetical protein